jgi:hypothetical protein
LFGSQLQPGFQQGGSFSLKTDQIISPLKVQGFQTAATRRYFSFSNWRFSEFPPAINPSRCRCVECRQRLDDREASVFDVLLA